MKKKSSFRTRYLLSFAVIMLLPMLCLLWYIYYSVQSNLYRETVATNAANLSQVSNSIDKSIQKLENIALLARANPNLKPYFLEQSAFNSYLAVNTLKDIASINDLLSTISVYNMSNDLVVSNFGTCPKEYWGSKVLPIQLEDGTEIRSYVEQLTQPAYRVGTVRVPGLTEQQCLLYFYPISISGDKPISVAVMIIQEKSLIELFNIGSTNWGDTWAAYNKDGICVAAVGDTPERERLLEAFFKDRSPLEAASLQFSHENATYAIAYQYSFQTGWSYLSVQPLSVASELLVQKMQSIAWLYILVLLLSGLGIYFALRVNYYPLLKLKREIEPLLNTDSMNELESIRTAVDMLKSDVYKMSTQIHNSQPTLKNYLLQQILWGRITSPAVFEELTHEVELRFAYDSFVVGVVTGLLENPDKLTTRLHSLRMRPDVYCLEREPNGPIYLLLNVDGKSYIQYRDQLSAVMDQLYMEGLPLCLSLGSPYPFPLIDRSRFEATIAYDFRRYGPEKPLVYSFDDILHESGKMPSSLLSEPAKDFELALLRDDVETIARFPDQVIRNLEEHHLSGYYGSYIVYDLAMVMVRCMVGPGVKQSFLNQLFNLLYAGGHYYTIERVRQLVSFVCEQAVAYINCTETNEESQINGIIAYIEQNYMRSDFSIQMVAQQFGMSPSWLSHYFKANTRITVTEYVQNLRMKLAKMLIEQEAGNVQELADQLGYSNTSSFIRAFKKSEGVTPKQYQELCKRRSNKSMDE